MLCWVRIQSTVYQLSTPAVEHYAVIPLAPSTLLCWLKMFGRILSVLAS